MLTNYLNLINMTHQIVLLIPFSFSFNFKHGLKQHNFREDREDPEWHIRSMRLHHDIQHLAKPFQYLIQVTRRQRP